MKDYQLLAIMAAIIDVGTGNDWKVSDCIDEAAARLNAARDYLEESE